ncbi:hypothetical protein QCA50_010252 [Cerrena zonata]|uniref:Uncharacterized protein n=1 Tax=Cerrena zonata TaxID=2478898 RepID=A0AAW0G9T5_9APHY
MSRVNKTSPNPTHNAILHFEPTAFRAKEDNGYESLPPVGKVDPIPMSDILSTEYAIGEFDRQHPEPNALVNISMDKIFPIQVAGDVRTGSRSFLCHNATVIISPFDKQFEPTIGLYQASIQLSPRQRADNWTGVCLTREDVTSTAASVIFAEPRFPESKFSTFTPMTLFVDENERARELSENSRSERVEPVQIKIEEAKEGNAFRSHAISRAVQVEECHDSDITMEGEEGRGLEHLPTFDFVDHHRILVKTVPSSPLHTQEFTRGRYEDFEELDIIHDLLGIRPLRTAADIAKDLSQYCEGCSGKKTYSRPGDIEVERPPTPHPFFTCTTNALSELEKKQQRLDGLRHGGFHPLSEVPHRFSVPHSQAKTNVLADDLAGLNIEDVASRKHATTPIPHRRAPPPPSIPVHSITGEVINSHAERLASGSISESSPVLPMLKEIRPHIDQSKRLESPEDLLPPGFDGYLCKAAGIPMDTRLKDRDLWLRAVNVFLLKFSEDICDDLGRKEWASRMQQEYRGSRGDTPLGNYCYLFTTDPQDDIKGNVYLHPIERKSIRQCLAYLTYPNLPMPGTDASYAVFMLHSINNLTTPNILKANSINQRRLRGEFGRPNEYPRLNSQTRLENRRKVTNHQNDSLTSFGSWATDSDLESCDSY